MTPWPYCKAKAHLEQGSPGRHSTPEMLSGTTGLPIAAAEGSYHNAGGPPTVPQKGVLEGGRRGMRQWVQLPASPTTQMDQWNKIKPALIPI